MEPFWFRRRDPSSQLLAAHMHGLGSAFVGFPPQFAPAQGTQPRQEQSVSPDETASARKSSKPELVGGILRRIAEIDSEAARLIPPEEVFAELRRLLK